MPADGEIGALELELHANLCLERIEHVTRGSEAELRRRRDIGINPAPDRVDILDVGPVEQVEEVEADLEPGAVAADSR